MLNLEAANVAWKLMMIKIFEKSAINQRGK